MKILTKVICLVMSLPFNRDKITSDESGMVLKMELALILVRIGSKGVNIKHESKTIVL